MSQPSDRRMVSLQTLQKTVWSAITSEAAPGALEALVVHDARCSVARRVEVYASMYRVRLRESLAQDFPKLRAALGADAFDAWVDSYVRAHPSTRPTLRDLGRHLPAFLRAHGGALPHPALADLAALEWARLDVFDREDEPLLSMDDVARHADGGFAALRLAPIAAHVLLALAHPVVPLWRALHDAPERALAVRDATAACARVLVWRKADGHVYHRTLDPLEAGCLRALGAAPTDFADLCALAAERLSPPEAAQRMAELLASWLAEGLLRAPHG
ncbi:MAG: DNA-binding domain-containing protein [Polyangiales bacterium]